MYNGSTGTYIFGVEPKTMRMEPYNSKQCSKGANFMSNTFVNINKAILCWDNLKNSRRGISSSIENEIVKRSLKLKHNGTTPETIIELSVQKTVMMDCYPETWGLNIQDHESIPEYYLRVFNSTNLRDSNCMILSESAPGHILKMN